MEDLDSTLSKAAALRQVSHGALNTARISRLAYYPVVPPALHPSYPTPLLVHGSHEARFSMPPRLHISNLPPALSDFTPIVSLTVE